MHGKEWDGESKGTYILEVRMNEEEYIKGRLDNQIQWYDKKSQTHQSWYKGLKILELTSGFSIPIFTTLKINRFEVWVTILSGLILLSEGLIALYNHQNNWIDYRRTSELLKHEKYMHSTNTGVYSNETIPFKLLVERVETLISSENINWANMETNRKEKE